MAIKWRKEQDTNYHHTAATRYVSDDFIVWKGKRHICYCFYSADEWHLERKKDGQHLHGGKTAKECMNALAYCEKKRKGHLQHGERGSLEGHKV